MVQSIIILVFCVVIIVMIGLYYRRLRRKLEKERMLLLLQQDLLREQSAQLQETEALCRSYRKEIRQMMKESGLFSEEEMKDFADDQELMLPTAVDAGMTDNAVTTGVSVPERETGEAAAADEHFCGNVMIQAILQHKEIECRRRKIPFTFDIVNVDKIDAEDIDLVGIFYNLLDNAIEASSRIGEPSERIITVRSGMEKKYWTLTAENKCLPLPGNTKLGTTWKEDPENHGIGLSILYDLVRKNRGRIQFGQEKDVFRAEIRMPMKKEKKGTAVNAA